MTDIIMFSQYFHKLIRLKHLLLNTTTLSAIFSFIPYNNIFILNCFYTFILLYFYTFLLLYRFLYFYKIYFYMYSLHHLL